jgi:SAM-dependent methyltransferase
MEGSHEESLRAWEANAVFWDLRMGDESNAFHQNLVRPNTETLLNVQPGDFVLDIACGNGNFSSRLAEMGARVVAFDYSPRMIELARRRRAAVLGQVEFFALDATNLTQLLGLKREVPYAKAVSNMAVMDISDVLPLFKAVYQLLADGGVFVFTTFHPCFTRPEGCYLTPCMYKGEAIHGQPVQQNYYHRSLMDVLNPAFDQGFMLDRLLEVADDDPETPVILTVRLRKTARREPM